jgi:hypothetical protein
MLSNEILSKSARVEGDTMKLEAGRTARAGLADRLSSIRPQKEQPVRGAERSF